MLDLNLAACHELFDHSRCFFGSALQDEVGGFEIGDFDLGQHTLHFFA